MYIKLLNEIILILPISLKLNKMENFPFKIVQVKNEKCFLIRFPICMSVKDKTENAKFYLLEYIKNFEKFLAKKKKKLLVNELCVSFKL